MRFKAKCRALSWLLTALMLLSSFLNIMPLTVAGAETDTTPPAWENGTLNATAVTDQSLTLDWSGAQDDTGVTGYIVYENSSVLTMVYGADTCDVSGLQPAASYNFAVQALDAAGNESTTGPGVTVTTTQVASGSTDQTAPTWTDGVLNTANITATGLTLNWSGASDDTAVTGYKVYQGTELLVALGDVTTYDVSGLSAASAYTFTVQALDAAGNESSNGPTATATTATTATTAATPESDATAPAWPSDSTLTASNVAQNSLTLTWTGATDDVGVTGYQIYQDNTVLTTVDGNTLNYNVTGLTAGTPYSFKVEAGDAAGNWSSGGPSADVTTAAAVTADTRVTAYLASINSDNITSTNIEAIDSSVLAPLNPIIKLKFAYNVIANTAQNINCITLLDSSGQQVPNVNVFSLGDTSNTQNPEKTNLFVQPQTQLTPNSTYKIVVSPDVTFKNGSTLGEPAVEIPFTTVADIPDVALTSALLSGQTLTLTGLPDGAELEYRIVTGSTSGDWTALPYTGTTAAIDAAALSILTGTSQVEVRVKGGDGATVSKTVFLTEDGNQVEMQNGVPLCFEDNVTVTAENLDSAATNRVSLKRTVINKKYYITPVGFAYEVYLQGAGDGKKVTLTFPVDPSPDINKMSVYTGDLLYLTPDRSQADKHLISITTTDVPEAGGTFVYQVFYDNTVPGPVAFTAPPTVDIENHKIVFPQIQCYDNDCISYVEVYRNGQMIGYVDGSGGFGSAKFIDSDPTLQVGQTYAYNMKAYDRMGNWDWCTNNAPPPGEIPNQTGDVKVLFSANADVFATIRQQLEDGTIPIVYADGDNADHVIADIKLPWTTSVDEQVRIWWTSSDPEIIKLTSAESAMVVKPADGSDRVVTLTATIKRGEVIDPVTVSKQLRVTWEPWANGVMPVHTLSELQYAINQDNIQTVILKDGFPNFPNNVFDAKGKTLVVGPFAVNAINGAGVNIIIKNAVIDANGSEYPGLLDPALGYSFVALAQSRSGYDFENVEFKGGENLDSFILSHGGSLVLTNCRFGSTKVAPVIVTQGNAVNEPTGIRIENCTFDGAGKPGYGVLYDKIGTLTAVNNNITGYQGTMTSGGPSAGLLITPGRTATLIGNKISNCDDGILVQTKSTANTVINGVKITDAASAATAGTALLTNNELTAGSGPVVVVNNVDSVFHPVVLYQAATDDQTASSPGAPAWAANSTLTASAIDETELTLTWIGASDTVGVTGYRVYQGADLIAIVSNTSCHVTGLRPGQTYQFRVEAGNAEGKWSLDGPVTTAATLPNTLPVWPEGSKVTVTAVNPNSVILSWTPATDKEGLHAYWIGVNGQRTARWTAPGCLGCEVNELQPDTEYTFQIYAEDALSRLYSPGPSVTARTAASSAMNWSINNKIIVSNLNSTSLTLNWAQPWQSASSGLQYKLYQNGEVLTTFTYGYTLLPFTCRYNVTGLQPGTTYNFKLELMDTENSETTDGPSISVTTPAQGSQSGYIGQPVDIYFQGDTEWMNSISDVLLGVQGAWPELGTSVFNQCTITTGHILIAAGVFENPKNDTVVIRANGYPDIFVNQIMVADSSSKLLAPSLAAAVNNTVGLSVKLTFADNEAWRAAITGITVDGAVVDKARYSVAAGVITIDSSVFTAAKDYAIVVNATGYNDAAVTQTMKALASNTWGDVNNDGTVNILDVVQAVNFALGKATPTAAQLNAADLNGDGNINILDVVQMVKKAVGN
ncbi:Exoglucanase B precursor [Pelotomaculum sp. FP]|uniref:fibronectin type III domain-containing protein n=1 Tax=Pelotomaculum sp. FP TaxID=261474 RepID=UPI001066E7FC|nr:fibronectin type III domain-containing protein [Pelotomaculum sp. FP]TEB14842.1 Exoglucanase B precursor [Pelotomaculum sp. FP]